MPAFVKTVVWTAISVTGAAAVAVIAFTRGETINAIWFVIAAISVYAIAYRFYSSFLAATVLALDESRITPAARINDGRDFVPTNRWVVFGHHFAAIAGPGPLIGPTLAAQFGYLPGTLWILAGVVLGGAVQDFCVLSCSLRRDGKSLGQMAREEIGVVGGFVAHDRRTDDHGDPHRGARARRHQRVEEQPMGDVHGRRHHSDRDADGLVHAARSAGRRPRGDRARARASRAWRSSAAAGQTPTPTLAAWFTFERTASSR